MDDRSLSIKYGDRTRVSSLRGWRPCRLDEPDMRGLLGFFVHPQDTPHGRASRLAVCTVLLGKPVGIYTLRDVCGLVEPVGFEPTVFCLQGRRIAGLMLQPQGFSNL